MVAPDLYGGQERGLNYIGWELQALVMASAVGLGLCPHWGQLQSPWSGG